MKKWQLVKTPLVPGTESMAADLASFNAFEKGEIPSTLRVYSWRPRCVSFGYSQKVDGLIGREVVGREGWDMVRRPTGGGIVYHDEGEISYSVVTAIGDPVLPDGLIPSYLKISEAIVYALSKVGIAAAISRSKVENGESKIGLCFASIEEYEIVSDGKKIVGSAQKRGKRALLQQGTFKLGRKIGLDEMAAAMKEGFEQILGVKFQ